jgi:hypothetical protein
VRARAIDRAVHDGVCHIRSALEEEQAANPACQPPSRIDGDSRLLAVLAEENFPDGDAERLRDAMTNRRMDCCRTVARSPLAAGEQRPRQATETGPLLSRSSWEARRVTPPPGAWRWSDTRFKTRPPSKRALRASVRGGDLCCRNVKEPAHRRRPACSARWQRYPRRRWSVAARRRSTARSPDFPPSQQSGISRTGVASAVTRARARARPPVVECLPRSTFPWR